MELVHLLTRSGLTYPEVSSKLYHDSFCQLGSSVSLPWVICFETFYLHVVSSFSCIPVICPKIGVIFNSFAICAFVCYIRPLSVPHSKRCPPRLQKTIFLMFCKAKFAVYSEIHTKHTNSMDHYVEFLNVKTYGKFSYR